VYCAAAEASTLLEVLAHAIEVPINHVLVVLNVPDGVRIIDPPKAGLPSTWRDLPYHAATQAVGDRFLAEGKALLLRLPSAITTTDRNFLLNPAHPDAARVTWKVIDPYPFDPRLFKETGKPKA
jgi:RES domain-containing protein